MTRIRVDGQDYEYDIERTPVVAWAIHSAQREGEIFVVAVQPLFEHSGSSETTDFHAPEGYTQHVAFLPGTGAVSVDVSVTHLLSKARKNFELGIETRRARLDIPGELHWLIQVWAEKRVTV